MAKILKLGVNPVFGIEQDEVSKGVFLADSYSIDVQPKSVEITNGLGQKSGEVIYDQSLTYNYSGTLQDVSLRYLTIGSEDTFASAMFNSRNLDTLVNQSLPYNCEGKSIIKNISISYNAGQVAKITVTGEHLAPGTK